MKTRVKNDYLYFENKEDIGLYEKIEKKEFKILKILKDDQRSFVAVIEIEKKKYVFKEPREKNRRKWQRFLSIFRGSESKREFDNLKKIKNIGFRTATPHIAVEKRKGLLCVDSYLIISYIEGMDGNIENIDLIFKELEKIHSSGYLHGDSHLANFMIKNDEVYVIDTKFLYNIYGKFGAIFEYIYLEESCGKNITYDKKSFYYIVAMLLKRYLLWFGKLKKKLKKK